MTYRVGNNINNDRYWEQFQCTAPGSNGDLLTSVDPLDPSDDNDGINPTDDLYSYSNDYQSTDPALISPPINQNEVAQSPHKIMTLTELQALKKRGVAFKVHEIWFNPAQGLSREILKNAFGLPSLDLVHDLSQGDPTQSENDRFRVEILNDKYSVLNSPQLPEMDETVNKLEAAKRQLAIRVALSAAGLTSAEDLKKGNLQIKFTTDEDNGNIEQFVVYWVTNSPKDGIKTKVIAYQIKGKKPYFDSKIKNANKYIKVIQKLLKLKGYLPVMIATDGKPSEQTITTAYTYFMNTPILFQPRKDEAERRLTGLSKKAEKLLRKFVAVYKNKNITRKFKVKNQVLAQLAKELVSTSAQIQSLAERSIETFSEEGDREFRERCKKLVKRAKSNTKVILNSLIGVTHQDSNNYFYNVDLFGAENKIKTYLETLKKADKAYGKKRETRKLEAESMAEELISTYTLIYNTLRNYELQFSAIPGVKERTVALRKVVLERLDKKLKELKKKHGAAATNIITRVKTALNRLELKYKTEPENLSQRLNSLYETADKWVTGTEDKDKITDPKKLRYLHGKAAYISSEILKDHPARMLLISFFKMMLGREEKVSLRLVFKKFRALLAKRNISEKDIDILGKYLWIRNLFSEQGKSSKDGDKAAKKVLKGDYYKAKRILEVIKRVCKPANNSLKASIASNRMINTLQTFVRIFYNQKLIHNSWAAAYKGKAVSYTELSAIGTKIAAALPQKGYKKVFSILANVSEDPALAKNEISGQLETELIEIAGSKVFGKTLVAKKFLKKAQTLTFTPRFFGKIASDAGERQQAYHSSDIRDIIRPELLVNMPKEPGNYFFAEVTVDGKKQLIFQKAPDGVRTAVLERDLGGTLTSRGIMDFVEKCGAGMINLALIGKGPATGALRAKYKKILTNALGHMGIRGLIIAASKGDYEIRGGLNLTSLEQIIIKKVIAHQANGLKLDEKELLVKLIGRGKTFKDYEAPHIRDLVIKLAKLGVSFLSRTEKIVYASTVSKLADGVNNHLTHKGGLDKEEVLLLKKMATFMEKYDIIITDGRFIHTRPTKAMIAKVAAHEQVKFISTYKQVIPILQKIHFQLQKLAAQYAPDEEIFDPFSSKGEAWKFYKSFWKKVWHAMRDTVAPPKITMFQAAGLPPIQLLSLKIHLDPGKLTEFKRVAGFILILKDAQTKGKAALSAKWVTEAHIKELITLFKVKDKNGLEKLFGAIKNAGVKLADFRTIITKGPKNLKALKAQLRKIIAPVEKELRRIEKRLKWIGLKFKDTETDATHEDREIDKENHKALALKHGQLQIRFGRLKALESAMGQILTIEKSGRDNPIKFLSSLPQLISIVSALAKDKAALFSLGSLFGKQALFSDIQGAIYKIDAALKEVQASRNAYISWVEIKQKFEISKQQITSFFSSDKFGKKEWDNLRKKLPYLIKDTNWKHKVATWLGRILVQQDDNIYGKFSRIAGKPLELLDKFFGRGGEVNLRSTTPVLGEKMLKTLAKIALTKIFERIPQQGSFNVGMPLLLTVFGGHGGPAGIWNAGRDITVMAGRATGIDRVSYGAGSMRGKLKIASSGWARTKYYALSALALSSNTISPKMPMAEQFHQMMIYGPYGQKYLARKQKEAAVKFGGDMGKALSVINQDDLKAFIKYIKKDVINKIRHNPALLVDVNALIGKHFLVSKLLRTVVKDAVSDAEAIMAGNKPQKRDYSALLKALNPGNEEFTLADSQNENNAHALAQVLEDLFKINPLLMKSRGVENFKKDPLSSMDVVARWQEITGSKDKPHDLQVLDVDPDASPGINRPISNILSKALKDAHDWFAIYTPRIKKDFKAAFKDKDSMIKFAKKTAYEILEGAGKVLDYGWMMGRRISMGLSDLWGGIADYIAAKDDAGRLKALNRIKDGLAHTGGAFTSFESLPVIFYLAIVDHLENGRYGAAMTEAVVITKMFGVGLKAIFKGGAWGVKVGKVAVVDKFLRGKMKLFRFSAKIPRSAALDKFVSSNSKFAYTKGGKLKVRGKLTSAEISTLTKMYPKGKGKVAVEKLIRQSAGAFEPPAPHIQKLMHGTGVKIILAPTGYPIVKFIVQNAVTKGGSAASGAKRKFGSLSLSISPGNEVFAGESTNSRTMQGGLGKAWRYFRYYTKPRMHVSGLFSAAGVWGGVKTVVASPFRAIPYRSKSATIRTSQDHVIDMMKRAQADPNGYTTLEFYRGITDAQFARVNELQIKIGIESQQLQAYDKAGTLDSAEALEVNKQLESHKAELQRLNGDIQKGKVESRIKNSHFLEMVKNPTGVKSYWRYFTAIGKGTIPEIKAQFRGINEVYLQSKGAVDAAKADPNRPKSISYFQMMREIASPRAKGANKVYTFQSRSGRVIYLRGSQIAKIMDATLHQKSFDFVREYGITAQEAGQIGQEIQKEFGIRHKRLSFLVKFGLLYKTTSVEPVKINISTLPTVNGRRMISFADLAAKSGNVKSILGGRQFAYAVIKSKSGTIEITPELLMNYNGNTSSILYINEGGKAEFLGIKERFAREGIQLKGSGNLFDPLLKSDPAAIEGLIKTLKGKNVGVLAFSKMKQPLTARDLTLIDSNIQKNGSAQKVAVKGYVTLSVGGQNVAVPNTVTEALPISIPKAEVAGAVTIAKGKAFLALDVRTSFGAGIKAIHANARYIIIEEGFRGEINFSVEKFNAGEYGFGEFIHVDKSGKIKCLNIAERFAKSGIVMNGGFEAFSQMMLEDPAAVEKTIATLEKNGIKKINFKGSNAKGEFGLQLDHADLKQIEVQAKQTKGDKITVKENHLQAVRFEKNFEAKLRELGKAVGIKGVQNMNLFKLTRLANRALRKAGKAQFINSPEALLKLMAEKSKRGKKFRKFLKDNPEFRSLADKLEKTPTAKATLRKQIAMELGIGLGLFLIAEKQASWIGIKDPMARFGFVLISMHVMSVPISKLSLAGLQKAYTGAALALTNATKFSGFLMEQYGTKSLSRIIGRMSWGTLKGMFGAKAILHAGKGMFGVGMGGFYLVSKAFSAIGVESLGWNIGMSMTSISLTKYFLQRQVQRIAKRIAEKRVAQGLTALSKKALLKQAFSKSILGRLSPALRLAGHIGVALFVIEMIDLARLCWFENAYDRSHIMALRKLQDLTGSNGVALDNKLRFKALRSATHSWMGMVLNLRGQVVKQLNNPAFFKKQTVDRYYYSQLSDNHLPPITLKLTKGMKETIKYVHMISIDNFKGTPLATAIKQIKALFNKDGSVKDQAKLREYVLHGVWSDIKQYRSSDRHQITFFGSNQSHQALHWKTPQKLLNAFDFQEAYVVSLRKARRLEELVHATETGQPIFPTKYDREQGFVTAAGKLNRQNPVYLKMVGGQYKQIVKQVRNYISRGKGTELPEHLFLLSLKELSILNHKINYLLNKGKTDAEAALKAMRIKIEPEKWEKLAVSFTKITAAFKLLLASYDNDTANIIKKLKAGEKVEGLQDFYNVLQPALVGKSSRLFSVTSLQIAVSKPDATRKQKFEYLARMSLINNNPLLLSSLVKLSTKEKIALKDNIKKFLNSRDTSTDVTVAAIRLMTAFNFKSLVINLIGKYKADRNHIGDVDVARVNKEVKDAFVALVTDELSSSYTSITLETKVMPLFKDFILGETVRTLLRYTITKMQSDRSPHAKKMEPFIKILAAFDNKVTQQLLQRNRHVVRPRY